VTSGEKTAGMEKGIPESKASVPPGASAPGANYTLLLLTLVGVLNYLDRGVFSAVLQSIKSEMHLSDTAIGLVAGFAFVLFYSFLGVPIGYLADRFSRCNIIAIGLTFWSIMTALTGFAANVWQLAVARFLMGAGEATGLAPSHAMVSDLYNKERRSLALGILATASTVGSSLAYAIGGWMNQHYGWRSAFYVAGVPGILLAILFVLTVKEPTRGAYDKAKSIKASTFTQTMAFLARSKTYIFVLIGFSLAGISVYASMVWSAAFMIRVHHLSSAAAGAFIGIGRLMSIPGYLAGGFLAERLARRDERWRVWVPSLGCVLACPATLMFIMSNTGRLSFVGLCFSSFFASIHFAPVIAICMNVAKVRMRAVASATLMFFANIVGQIVGPLGVGYLNDAMTSAFGSIAIRYSMVIGGVCMLIAGGFIYLSAGYIMEETKRAAEG
jgi:MFS family permease